MGIGYTGKVTFNGNISFATDGSITVLRDAIESAGAYGGTVSGNANAMGGPHIYDPWKTQSHISFDVTSSIVSEIESLLKERDSTYSISLSLGNGGGGVSTDQYWTEISFGATVGSLVSGSIGGIYFKKSEVSGGAIDQPNKMGETSVCDEILIPYWQTKVGDSECCYSWNFSANQTVSPIYCCNVDDDEERDPDYIVIGQMVIVETVSAAQGDPGDGGTITIGSSSITLSNLDKISKSASIHGGTSFNTYDVTYRAYDID